MNGRRRHLEETGCSSDSPGLGHRGKVPKCVQRNVSHVLKTRTPWASIATRIGSISHLKTVAMRNEVFLAGLISSATLSPGPNNMLIASVSAREGFRRSLLSVGVIVLAGILMVLAAATVLGRGLSPPAIRAIELVGCAILVWFAIDTWRSTGSRWSAGRSSLPPWSLFALQLANPKAILLTVTVTAAAEASFVPLAETCALVASISFVSLLLWSAGGAIMAHVLRTSAALKRTERLLSLLLIGNALMLLATALGASI